MIGDITLSQEISFPDMFANENIHCAEDWLRMVEAEFKIPDNANLETKHVFGKRSRMIPVAYKATWYWHG
tara:strand:- start:580 stop:789 length:210 start_codon:yes stop_codon:yes gene_type:complete